MTPYLTLSRQRVPMLDASTLEDRTRPALDGTTGARLRYFSWPHWHTELARVPSQRVMWSDERLGRRRAG